ncbi:MAG TPA: hypothetical protein VEF89_20950 [Solirubrobacteraceae bacterium]|nr:hypothetical protein [Solirubrobacteraceae bacterium]
MAVQQDPYDELDDEALVALLTEQANKRRERVLIEQREGRWIAESYQTDGLSSGRSVMLGAAGPDRHTAMVGLIRKFEANR